MFLPLSLLLITCEMYWYFKAQSTNSHMVFTLIFMSSFDLHFQQLYLMLSWPSSFRWEWSVVGMKLYDTKINVILAFQKFSRFPFRWLFCEIIDWLLQPKSSTEISLIDVQSWSVIYFLKNSQNSQKNIGAKVTLLKKDSDAVFLWVF